MDTKVLVDSKYEIGKELIDKLDLTRPRYPIIFWMNPIDTDYWILVLGVPKLSKKGSKAVFSRINKVIIDNAIPITLNDITLKDTLDPLLITLKKAIVTEMAISEIRFINNYINGQRFPDSIIYRVG